MCKGRRIRKEKKQVVMVRAIRLDKASLNQGEKRKSHVKDVKLFAVTMDP